MVSCVFQELFSWFPRSDLGFRALEGWYSAIVFESCAHLARCGSSQYCWCRFWSSWQHEVRFIIFPCVPWDLFARCLLVFTFYTACDGYFVAINSAILMVWDEECNLPYSCLSTFLHFSVTFSFVGPIFCYQIPSSIEYANLKPASNNSYMALTKIWSWKCELVMTVGLIERLEITAGKGLSQRFWNVSCDYGHPIILLDTGIACLLKVSIPGMNVKFWSNSSKGKRLRNFGIERDIGFCFFAWTSLIANVGVSNFRSV